MDQNNIKSEQLSSNTATQENINSKDKLKNSIASILNEDGFNGELVAEAVMNYREDGQSNTFSIMALDALPKHIDYNSNPDALGIQYYKLLRTLTQMKLLNSQQVNEISEFVYETLGIVEQQQKETGIKVGQNEDFFINEMAQKNYDPAGLRVAIQEYKNHNSSSDLVNSLLALIPEEIAETNDRNLIGSELYYLTRTLQKSNIVSKEIGDEIIYQVQQSFGKVLEDEQEKAAKKLEVDLENPSAYREIIKETIENEFAEQYGFQAISNVTSIINSMAKSVGYDGKQLVNLFENTNSTGDELTDKFVQLYLNSNARDYLMAAQDSEQVSGFINSL